MEERNYIPSPEEISGLATYGQALFLSPTEEQYRNHIRFIRTMSNHWHEDAIVLVTHSILLYQLEIRQYKPPQITAYLSNWRACRFIDVLDNYVWKLHAPLEFDRHFGISLHLSDGKLYRHKGAGKEELVTEFNGTDFWAVAVRVAMRRFFLVHPSPETFPLNKIKELAVPCPFPIIAITQPL